MLDVVTNINIHKKGKHLYFISAFYKSVQHTHTHIYGKRELDIFAPYGQTQLFIFDGDIDEKVEIALERRWGKKRQRERERRLPSLWRCRKHIVGLLFMIWPYVFKCSSDSTNAHEKFTWEAYLTMFYTCVREREMREGRRERQREIKKERKFV